MVNYLKICLYFLLMKAFVYINSLSGAGYAEEYYNKYLKEFINTHFSEIEIINIPCCNNDYRVNICDNNESNTIFIVGGDGTLSMTIEKILEFSDFEDLEIPIFICPFGSGNGIAKNLDIDPYNLKIDCNKKYIRPLQMFIKEVEKKSFLSQTWGIISDIDINTEFLRSIGDLRYYYGILKSIILPNYYKGICSITDSDNFTTEIDGSFLFFCSSNAPWISKDFKIAPLSDIYTQEIDILLIRKELNFFDRLKLIYYLATESIHLLDFVEYFKAKEYNLKLLDDRSFIVSDGEKILSNEIKVKTSDKKFLFYCNN